MSDIDRAIKAKAIIESEMYQEAYELCRMSILDRIDKCPLNDIETAENLRKCLRLLRDVRANMLEAINVGKLAEFRIQQEIQKSKNPFKGLFR